MNDGKYSSRTAYVFETLENEILGGIYRDGDLLTELKLCEKFNVSRTPVREALNRLKQENLVVETVHGMAVVGVTAQDILDIYEIRKRIEGYATGCCAKMITSEQLAQLREVVDLQEFYTEQGVADHIKDTDSRFHEMIYAFCGSRTLRETLSDLHRKVQKYRKLSVENPRRAKIAVQEHRDILMALSKHDADEAEYLAVLHIENAKRNIALTAQEALASNKTLES